MGERPARRRRVLIEDARRNGHHLRATWHPERIKGRYDWIFDYDARSVAI